MESKAVLPLPPGMVPSASREDMTDLGEDEVEKEQENTVLKEGDFGVKEAGTSVEVKTSEIAVVPERGISNTHHAWGSEEEARAQEVTTVQAKTSTTSPFISTSTPYSQGQRNPVERAQQDHVTPKRVLSPLKKFNKVAPSPDIAGTILERGALKFIPGDDSPLKSSSASLLEQKAKDSVSSGKIGRPDSAPQKREDEQNRQGIPIDARVIVKSGEDIQEMEARTPLYSTVAKRTSTDGKKNAYVDPRAFMPTLDAYEPSPLEDSVVISNRGTAEPLNTSQVLENDYTATPDPLYSAVEEVDTSGMSEAEIAAYQYNPALLKQLKKHDDKKGNVQLVSIKGTGSVTSGAATSFPQGSSADMHALHYAAANGDKKLLAENIAALPISQDAVEMVLGSEKLVKRDGIDIPDSEGRSPLMHAVHNNRLQAVKTLAENGANINAIAADGSTALHQAAFTGTIEMVALLLSLGADGLTRDFEARTPLHWSTKNHDPKVIEILLDKVPGLDVNIRDGALMTALMWAAFHGRTEQVRTLIEKGADPSMRDMDGMTAVHWSIQRHDTRVLQMLINAASVQYVDNKGKTLMHQAAEQGSAKAVSLIKAVRPTSVDDIDKNGRTPLHWATVCENPDAIRALLHHGTDPNIRDFSGKTALDYATEKGMHYCGLILTKAEMADNPDSYHSILTYGSAPATVGFRALNFQEGQLLSADTMKEQLTKEQILQIQTVCTGSWVYKFTNNGKGPLHPRYFWINPSNIKICWAKGKDAMDKNTKSDVLVGTRSSASPAIYGRKDFDPIDKHKYAFTIFTSNRVVDAVAVSSEDYKLWQNGLQLILHLGSINVTRLMAMIQKASGGEQKPIP